jgi:hypothetical protein
MRKARLLQTLARGPYLAGVAMVTVGLLFILAWAVAALANTTLTATATTRFGRVKLYLPIVDR